MSNQVLIIDGETGEQLYSCDINVDVKINIPDSDMATINSLTADRNRVIYEITGNSVTQDNTTMYNHITLHKSNLDNDGSLSGTVSIGTN